MRIPLKTVDDIAALYEKKPLKEIIFAQHKFKELPPETRVYDIFTVNSLHELVEVVKANYEKVLEGKLQKKSQGGELDSDDSDEEFECEKHHSIRYLLTENDELLFALEGEEPPHFIMTGENNPTDSKGRCAGNIIFNKDFSKIVGINNKSGDFTPEKSLLTRVFAVVVALADVGKINLTDSINVIHQRETFRNDYVVPLVVLKEFVGKNFTERELAQFVAVNLQAKKREVTYTPPKESSEEIRSKISQASLKRPRIDSSEVLSSEVDYAQLEKSYGHLFKGHGRPSRPAKRRRIIACGLFEKFEQSANKENMTSKKTLEF